MIFVKTFKGYEDKTGDMDDQVNAWIQKTEADVVAVQTALSHEENSRAASGDLIYTLVYRSDAPHS